MVAVGFAAPATAQFYTGRIDVTLTDQTGGRLPGVTIDITGPVNQSAVSDAQGEAHFLNLPVGTYTVKARVERLQTVRKHKCSVVSGGAVPLDVRLGVAGTAETVVVTAETPVIDIKKTTAATNVTLEELQNIPSARDPWVVMQTVPSIVVDRVNVGGSESGQQSNFNAKGAPGSANTWNLDGIPITDLAATGSTPTYYDFDQFEEMNFTTGGADVQNGTPGVGINFVLKQGSNTPHGSTRYFFEREGLQGNNMPPEPGAGPRHVTDAVGGMCQQQLHRTVRQSHRQVRRLRLRAGRSDHEGSTLGVGLRGKDRRQDPHLRGRSRSDDLERLCAETEWPGEQRHSRRLHLLVRRQGQVRPGRGRHEACGNDPGSKGSDQDQQGRGQFYAGQQRVPGRPLRAYQRRLLARAPGRARQERVRRRRRRVPQLLLQLFVDPPAEGRQRGRQLLPGRARSEVRVFVEEVRRPVDHDMAGRAHHQLLGRVSEHARQGDPRQHEEHRRQVQQRVSRRHDFGEARHDQRRPPVGSLHLVSACRAGSRGARIRVRRSGRADSARRPGRNQVQHGDAASGHQLLSR